MPPYIAKIGSFRLRQKMAIFDYDWTLVRPISNGTFSKYLEDWKWLTPNVPDVLKKFYDKGYCIVVISNQTRNTEMKITQITNALTTLSIPCLLTVAFEEADKKPNNTMFNMIVENKKIDMEKSFYAGDALGRQGDWSDVDKKFAENINIKNIYSPDDLFETKIEFPKIKESKNQEVIVMVGYPGSGKTSIANTFSPEKYKVISGDDFSSSKKMIIEAEKYIRNDFSVIFDATNPTIEKRKEYIEFANKYNLKIRCIHVSTDMAESMFRNNKRNKVIPKVTYFIFRKKFVKPTVDEGFYEVITLNSV